MKKILLTLATLLVLVPTTALAEGGYVDSGCGSEPLPDGCGQVFFGGIVFILGLFALGWIYDTYKTKTDPAYRERSEQIRREYDPRHRR